MPTDLDYLVLKNKAPKSVETAASYLSLPLSRSLSLSLSAPTDLDCLVLKNTAPKSVETAASYLSLPLSRSLSLSLSQHQQTWTAWSWRIKHRNRSKRQQALSLSLSLSLSLPLSLSTLLHVSSVTCTQKAVILPSALLMVSVRLYHFLSLNTALI